MQYLVMQYLVLISRKSKETCPATGLQLKERWVNSTSSFNFYITVKAAMHKCVSPHKRCHLVFIPYAHLTNGKRYREEGSLTKH